MKIFSIIFILVLSGCYTTNKAKKQVVKAHALKPNVTAKLCSSFYPTKDSVKEVTKIIIGRNDTLTYTINDTILKNDTMYIYLDRTKYINRVDTVKHTVVISQENKAKEVYLNNTISDLKRDNTILTEMLSSSKKSRNNWRNYLIIIIALYLGKIYFTKRLF